VLAIVVATVAIVSRFFDVQVGDAMIAFAAERLRRDPKGTTGVVQFAYAIDFVAGIVGFAAVATVLAPAFGDDLVGPDGQQLMTLYGLTLLAATVDTTSLALMRLLGRFRFILAFTATREVVRFTLLGGVLASGGGLRGAIVALVIAEGLTGVIAIVAASRAVRDRLGARLTDRSRFASRDMRRGMLGMVFHTNFVSYSKIAVSQGPAVLLGAFHGPLEAGLYKIGTSIAAALGKLSDPAWAAMTPRLARLWNAGRPDEIQRLLYQSTVVAFTVMATIAVAAAAAREPLLRLFGGEEATAAGTVLVLALIAKVVNGTFFWNTSALYATKHARTASRLYLSGAAVFIPLLVVCSHKWGANGAAAAGVVWALQVNGTLTLAALRLVGFRGRQPVSDAAPSV
jgi:O-antigen/teichoic acid export membrane protein